MSDAHYRVVSPSCRRPFLYPREAFAPRDLTPPPDWSTEHFAGGEYHSYRPDCPKALIMALFDLEPDALREWDRIVRELLAVWIIGT